MENVAYDHVYIFRKGIVRMLKFGNERRVKSLLNKNSIDNLVASLLVGCDN